MSIIIATALFFGAALCFLSAIVDAIKGKQKKLIPSNTRSHPVAQKPSITSNTQSFSKQKSVIKTGEWTVKLLLELEWKRFEKICTEYLIMTNQRAELTMIGADGGIDIVIKNADGKIIAIGQCKAWISNITVKEVREFFGVMASEKSIQRVLFCHLNIHGRGYQILC